jgi:flagellar basal body-associated protein FliL
VEFLQATFYILWIIFLLGMIIFVLTGFALMFALKKKADDTLEYVKKQSDEMKEKVEGFVSFKKNEVFMKGAGFVASKLFSTFKKK